jgi:hypothetical protein
MPLKLQELTMPTNRIWMILPYAALFVLAAWFYYLASHIDFTQRGDNPGPDFWPKLALAAIMIVCVIQGVRLAISNSAPYRAADDASAAADEHSAPRSMKLLAAGLILTFAYGALIGVLGFLIATILFMSFFMYAGKYWSHLTIWLSSIIGAVTMTILFQKIVYVSLPRGVYPFDQLSDLLLSLF